MSLVCRICLAGNTKLCPLKNNLLIDVYEKLSSTKFYSNAARPRAVCCYCYQKLLRCHTFSQMIYRSEQIFSSFVHEGFETIQKGLSEANLEIKQHLSIAAMQFIALDGYTTNAGSHVTIKGEPIPCIDMKEEVNIEQDNLVQVEFITEICTKTESILEDDSVKGDSDGGGRNDVEELPPYSYVKRTKPGDSKISFCCNNCNKIFSFKSKLISHIRKAHSPIGMQYTKKCTKRSNMVKVKVMPTKKSQFACDVCNKQFHSKCTLKVHERIHTGEKPYSCNVCDKNFTQKSSFNRHMRTHTGIKSFACDICDCRFLQNLDLARHMRTHTGEQPFGCKLCDKRFNRKYHLVTHMRIHTGERPFACSLCNKQFSRKSYATTHMKTHRREKPFVCDVCDKQYVCESAQIKHMSTHVKEC